jgi:DNA-binding CsgD family transcriptional regulator
MKGRELVPGVVRSMSKRDLLHIVDAAYADAAQEQSWLEGVLTAASPVLDWGLGMCAYTFTLTHEGPRIGNFVQSRGLGAIRLGVEELFKRTPPALLRSAFDHDIVSTLSDFLQGDLMARSEVGPFLAAHGARDCIGIVAYDRSDTGVVLSPFLPASGVLPAGVRRTWSQIVLHLNAGARLRGQPRTVDAVLDASGALHDARGPALDKGARAALRQAARAIDRARSRRASDPAEALALREALVLGQWSLVDRFDADGRHFLVACRNPDGAAMPVALSQREEQATALAARGYSNKRIASALGLSTGSVSTLLYRAARKWGAGSRTLLIQEWRKRDERAGLGRIVSNESEPGTG